MLSCQALKATESACAGASVDNTKKLRDLCIHCIMCNLHTIHQAGRFLAPVHKEQMIERLAFHDMLTLEYLPHVTYNLFAPQLRRINLYKCPQVTDAFLRQLAECRCKLESLTLQKLPNVSDEGIISITYGQDELVTLELRKLARLTSHGLSEVASPALHTLDLRACPNVTAEGIKLVVSKNTNIQKLVLILCLKVDVSVLAYVTETLTDNLVDLDVGELHTLNDACLTSIAKHCSKLKRLNIYGANHVTHDGLMSLFRSCNSLEILDLSYCSNLATEPSVQCLLELPSTLRELSLCGIMLENEDLLVKALLRLKHLHAVRLCGVMALNDRTLPRILLELGKQLTMLDLSGSVMSLITDDGLRAVSTYCTKLEILGIRLLKDVTGVTLLPWLRNEEYAEKISTLLVGCKRMDADILYAAAINCHNLVDLDVSGLLCVNSDLLCAVAENCPRLSHINLKGCLLVCDRGVCALSYHCPLVYIVLGGMHITDKSIFAIANSCSTLQEIYLNGCYLVTQQALAYLIDCCLYRVYVEHRVPNADPDQLMAKNLDTGEFCRADLL